MCGVPFAKGVDQSGGLADVVGEGQYIHGEDNKVHYYIGYSDKAGTKKSVNNQFMEKFSLTDVTGLSPPNHTFSASATLLRCRHHSLQRQQRMESSR